ncbi:hypothetical protein ACIBU0_05940 [Streptomyces sp. NPDC049627]|uniref:hypothetical protein n=1 Tax=Streptomyces sp. NPDC049627 TaxID=3365595 RepID=UPI0037B8818A
MTRKNRRLLGGACICLAVVAAVYGFGTAQAPNSAGAALAVALFAGSAWYLLRGRRNNRP